MINTVLYKYLVAVFCCLVLANNKSICQQTDLFKEIDQRAKEVEKNRVNYSIATFKSTRLINGHTVETTKGKVLDVIFSHRFSTLNRGIYELFGLDNATMRMGADYGINDQLAVGVGRSTFQKQYDGFVKYKLLRQSTGKRNMPITLTAMASANVFTLRNPDPSQKLSFSDRVVYTFQLLAARKFSANTSVQIMPALLHYNFLPQSTGSNQVVALGIGGRQKLSKRVSLNAEYYYIPRGMRLENTFSPLSVGFDIQTGGHVFQLHFTNSIGMTEKSFISQTADTWKDGGVHFGFNISRVFTIGKRKE